MKIGLFLFPVRFTSMAPIDIACLAGYVKGRGHTVLARDFNVALPVSNDCDTAFWEQEHNQETLFKKSVDTVTTWVNEILDFSPDFVGISVWPTQIYFSLRVAQLVKNHNKNIKIVLGGPWYSPRELIGIDCVDFAVYGEGERTLAEIVERGDSRDPIAGCARKIEGEIMDGGRGEEIGNLDSLPLPDYSSFNFDRYLFHAAYPILLNRGCSWNCSFCMHRSVWKQFRSRSAENILAEIQHCLAEHPFINTFYCCDHSLNSNMPMLEKLCDLIIERNITVRQFQGFGQVNARMLDREVLKKLKRAGFNNWGIGIESGSDRVLKSMKRPYTATEAETMLKGMYELGMVACIVFITGYPTESEEDFEQTLGFMSRVNRYVANMSVAPYCCVTKNDLASQPEKYGIHALHGGGGAWESAYSTPSIRARRYEATMAHLASLGISHRYSDSDRAFFTNLVKKNT